MIYSINDNPKRTDSNLSDDGSGSSTEDDESEPIRRYAEDKFKYQRKALFRKTLTL